jgi:hypothetical protein
MGYDHSSHLERLLIDHIVLCWLRLYDTELRYEAALKEGMSLTLGTYWERKLSSNQHRYLRAVESLARMRKLMERTPALQVNIAQQQIVAG